MFFFGAFSGNLLYLILAVSYLAGFSSLAFRTPDVQPDELKVAEPKALYILHEKQLQKYSCFYARDFRRTTQSVIKKIVSQTPWLNYLEAHFVVHQFTGTVQVYRPSLFARPPPFYLV